MLTSVHSSRHIDTDRSHISKRNCRQHYCHLLLVVVCYCQSVLLVRGQFYWCVVSSTGAWSVLLVRGQFYWCVVCCQSKPNIRHRRFMFRDEIQLRHIKKIINSFPFHTCVVRVVALYTRSFLATLTVVRDQISMTKSGFVTGGLRFIDRHN